MNHIKKYKKMMVVSVLVILMLLLPSGLSFAHTINKNTSAENSGNVRAGSSIKPMVFYLHNDTTSHRIFDYSTTYTFDTNLGIRGQHISNSHAVELNFYLFPQLSSNLTIDGNITVGIFVNTTGASTGSTNLNVVLYDVKYKSGNPANDNEVEVGSGSMSTPLTTAIDYYSVKISNVHYTFAANDSIRLYVEVQGGQSNYYTVWYGNATYDARIKMDSANYMSIQSVKTKNYKGNYTAMFAPDANNKTITIETTIGDPFGGYDIKYANITLYDPNGTIIVDNQSMSLVSGTPISYLSTFDYKWNYSGFGNGRYTIKIWALDNNGYYNYYHFQQYSYSPYDDVAYGSFVIGLKYFVNITVYDSFQNPLSNAKVYLVEQYGLITDHNITNESGFTELLSYNGTYSLEVVWHGNPVTWNGTEMVVNGTNVSGNTISIRGNTTVTVYADVGHFGINVFDSHSIAVRSALIFVGYPNGTYSSQTLKTDRNGYASVGYSPGGKYYIAIYWKNIEVYSGYITVHFSKEKPTIDESINVAIYYLTIKILNNQGMGVPYLEVVFYDSTTQLVEEVAITSSNGSATVRLPVGDKDIVAYSQNQVVYKITGFSLKSDATLTVNGYYYTLNLHVIDARGRAVENATIIASKNGSVTCTTTTNDSGFAVLNLIGGTYTVDIIWKGVPVNHTVVRLSGNTSITVKASIYYLGLEILNVYNKGTSGLRVVIYNSHNHDVEWTGTTDSNGEITARLPGGNKDIVAYDGSQMVYLKSDYSLNADATLVVHGWYYIANFHVLDSHSSAVPNATIIIIHDNNIITNLTTDNTGMATVSLINGTYSIIVIWENTEVNKSALNVQHNMSENVSTTIYYLTVNLQGNDNHAISGEITIMKNGKLVAEKDTSKFTVRLPAGTYTVRAKIAKSMYLTYTTEELSKGVSLGKDQQITLHFDKYPIPFASSLLFYVILGYLATVLVIIGICYGIAKRKSGKASLEEKEIKSENKDAEEDKIELPEESIAENKNEPSEELINED